MYNSPIHEGAAKCEVQKWEEYFNYKRKALCVACCLAPISCAFYSFFNGHRFAGAMDSLLRLRMDI